MAEKAFRQHPNFKWYIFTDADTFVSPSNLMTWLHELDHTRPLYLGNPSMIGSQTFGHGGSGYILSAPAMKAVAEQYSEERGYWDNFAAQNWAGDHIFGTMLQKRLDIPLTWSYPLLQADSPLLWTSWRTSTLASFGAIRRCRITTPRQPLSTRCGAWRVNGLLCIILSSRCAIEMYISSW